MTIPNASARFVSLVSIALLALTGCAEGDVPESASYNDADLKFVEQMIPHHQQAVDMSSLAEERAEDPRISRLASDIGFIQSIELEELRGWLLDWGISEGSDDHENHGEMSGMLTDAELQSLEATVGLDFDLLWAQLMLKHHEGAIAAAQTLLQDGKSEDVRFFAESLIQTQSAELEELQAIISRLSGT